MFYHRDCQDAVNKALEHFPVVLLTGSRQSGKSTLLQEAFPKYHYETLDDPSLRALAIEDPQLFLSSRPRPLAIDEIQYAPELFPYIKMEVDKNRSDYGRFLLTGSQTFQVMEQVTESLAGRVALFDVYPFSWSEVRQVYGEDLLSDRKLLELIIQGFYPEFFINPGLDQRRWFASYLATYLERDVRNIKRISDLSTFQTFIGILASRAGQLLNISEVAKECQISQPTAREWISILESTYIVYRLHPFHKNTTKRLTKSPKLYFVDSGMLCYLLGIDSPDRLIESSFRGHIFENFVITEAKKKQALSSDHVDFSFYRSASGVEIDLIISKLSQVHAFEIKMTKQPNKKMAKHLDSLREECGLTDTRVLTMQNRDLPLTPNVDSVSWYEALKI